VPEKPWWLRFDGAPGWLERSRDREAPPLRAAEIWILRAVMLGALAVMIWCFATGHLYLGLTLLLSITATITVAGAGMTRSQRGQIFGRRPRRDAG
jgi:small-conductance mechanosensitive channel